jgi:MGT family glycosyltransferase
VFARRAPIEAADLERQLEELDPDLLLVDINTWGAAAAAEASGLPWAMFSPYFLPLPSRDAPPFGLGLAPRADRIGRLRDRALYASVFRALERGGIPKVNGLRRERGLAPLSGAAGLVSAPDLLLYLTAEPLEYPRRDWPPNLRMIGPGIWDPPSQPPRWLEHIDGPLILVTASSERQGDDRLIEVALRGLAAEELAVIATTVSHEPARFATPANARVERFVPHGPILERAACVVCHGGMGITQKALSLGVPVCVVPFGRDQLEVARRVELAGAGSRLPASRLTPERLRDAVNAAIERRRGARRIAAAFAEAGGPPAAASALEALVVGRSEPLESEPEAG